MEVFKKGLDKFFYSDFYFFFIALIIFISWVFGLQIIGLTIIVLSASLCLILNEGVLPLFPILGTIPFIFSVSDIELYLPLAILLIPIVIAFIYHCFAYKVRNKLGKMFFPQIAVAIALIIGGCNVISRENYVNVLPYVLFLGLGVMIFYTFMSLYINEEKDINHATYIAKTLMWMGIILVAQMVTYYIRTDIPVTELWKGFIRLGWGIDNNVATLLLLTAPMCFYLMTQQKNYWAYMLIGIIQYITILFTYSRGGVFFAAITAPIVVIYAIVKTPHRKKTISILSFFIVVGLVAYFAMFNQINGLIKSFVGQGFGGRGRGALYKEAWQGFLAHPVFGLGMGYIGNNFEMDVVQFYWFHSTFFQVIGSMGIVGLIAYGYYYFARYKIVFKNFKRNIFNVFVFLSFLGFELYCLIDTGTFVPIPTMTMVMLMTLIVEVTNRKTDSKNLLRCENV